MSPVYHDYINVPPYLSVNDLTWSLPLGTVAGVNVWSRVTTDVMSPLRGTLSWGGTRLSRAKPENGCVKDPTPRRPASEDNRHPSDSKVRDPISVSPSDPGERDVDTYPLSHPLQLLEPGQVRWRSVWRADHPDNGDVGRRGRKKSEEETGLLYRQGRLQ